MVVSFDSLQFLHILPTILVIGMVIQCNPGIGIVNLEILKQSQLKTEDRTQPIPHDGNKLLLVPCPSPPGNEDLLPIHCNCPTPLSPANADLHPIAPHSSAYVDLHAEPAKPAS